MSSLEFEEKNVEKAVKKACKELNIARDELKYDVLSFGSSGIFGFAGAKKARIRVALPKRAHDAVTEKVKAQSVKWNLNCEAIDHKSAVENPAVEIKDSGDQQRYDLPENSLDLGRSVLQHIVECIDPDAKISAEESSERILLNVDGSNPAVLIGKKGQTLEAMQSLVEKIVNRNHNNQDKIRVQVDIGGYLETRKANLEKLAARMAEKSKRIRKPISLGHMSAYDRRIVHMALKDDQDVRTKSQGEGYLRKLTIFPKINHMQRQQSPSS